MGYFLQALIGKSQTLKANVSLFQNARIVLLEHDIAIIPITDELCEEIDAINQIEVEGFNKLSPKIEEWAMRISATGLVAHVVAEFFGGDGGQSAIAWNASSRVLGPIFEQDSINQVLKLLGVDRKNAHDEFNAVGLGIHRDTHDWK
jgi:hypothetical protein